MGIALLSQTMHLRRSPLDLFHPASPIQPPPLRGTSFHRKEGGRVHASPFPRKGLLSAARRGWLHFGAAKPPPLCLPHWGKGTASAVDRVLSQTAHLRRSFPLFFMPLVPYPARSARHLPLEGKAVSVVILFLHVSCIRFDDTRKAVFSYRSLPHWGRGTAQRRSGALVNGALQTHFPLSFIPPLPYPARSARHLPLEGKALSVVILFLHVSCIRFDDTRIPSSKKGGEAATRARTLNLEP